MSDAPTAATGAPGATAISAAIGERCRHLHPSKPSRAAASRRSGGRTAAALAASTARGRPRGRAGIVRGLLRGIDGVTGARDGQWGRRRARTFRCEPTQNPRRTDLSTQSTVECARGLPGHTPAAAPQARASDRARRITGVRAAALAEVACLARWALVDRVGDECLATPEVSGQGLEIGRWRSSLAQTIGVLLAGIGAVASAGRDLDDMADGAAAMGGCRWRGATVPWLLP